MLTIPFFTTISYGQVNTILNDSVKRFPDTLRILPVKPWRATALVGGTNLGVWAFDRFVIDGEYARISLQTMKKNLETGFVWDNDKFVTNLFAHPYHGGLYFNAARSNGMNYWKSIPYAAGGSLMWEFFMENELPSINDFVATTMGGSLLGEITFRLSDLLIDDSAFGMERFGREFLATLISPVRGINRLLSGDATRLRSTRGNTIADSMAVFYTSLGHSIYMDNEKRGSKDFANTLTYDISIYYGFPFEETLYHPYDYFTLSIGGKFNATQPFLSHANALAMLAAYHIPLKSERKKLVVGAFQHLNYYILNSEINHETLYPYKISEAASIGPGLLYKQTFKRNSTRFRGSFHLSGILLGGSQTDYYFYDERDYNLGSGFSTKLNTEIIFRNKIRLYSNLEDYHIYSWIGENPHTQISFNPHTQGDVGRADLTVLRLGLNIALSKHFLISNELSFTHRKSTYKYYPDVVHTVYENKLTLGYFIY
ncbi:MAG: DUF3943 domain-containing protein [Paludibacteraceae bacterium]